jgi:hypothetical protein
LQGKTCASPVASIVMVVSLASHGGAWLTGRIPHGRTECQRPGAPLIPRPGYLNT